MGLLARVLKGVGSYLVQKAELDAKQAMADLVWRRDLALKQMQMQHDYALEDKRLANDVTKIRTTGEENRLNALTQGLVTQRVQEADDARDLENTIKIEGVKFEQTKDLRGLEHKYNLAEGAADDARALSNELAKSGQTVSHWEVTKGGRLVALNGRGQVLSYSQRDLVNPTRAPSREGGGGSVLEEYGGGGAPPAAARSTPGPSQASQQERLLKAYSSATPQTAPGLFDANGKKKPFDQVMREMNQGG